MEIYKMESSIGERSTNRYYRFILSGTKMNSVYELKDYDGDDSIYNYDASELSNLVTIMTDRNRYKARRISSDAYVRANMKYIHAMYRLYYNALSSYVDTSKFDDDEELCDYDGGKKLGVNYLSVSVSALSNRVCHAFPIVRRIKRMYIDVPMVISRYVAKENNLSFTALTVTNWDAWYQQTRVVDSIQLMYNEYHTNNYRESYHPKRMTYETNVPYSISKIACLGDDSTCSTRPTKLDNGVRFHKIKFKHPAIIHTNGTKGVV